jgi:hypothetical protein
MSANTKVKKSQISRRKLLQTASAGLAVAVVPLAAANASAPSEKKKLAASDPKAFAPMALWLALTTNASFNNLDASAIAQATGVDKAKVQKYLDLVNDAGQLTVSYNNYAAIFVHLRTKFQLLALDAGYSGGQCPKGLDTISAVAALGNS